MAWMSALLLCAAPAALAQVSSPTETANGNQLRIERAPLFDDGKVVGDVSFYTSPDGSVRLHQQQLEAFLNTRLTVLPQDRLPRDAEPFTSVPVRALLAEGLQFDLKPTQAGPQIWISPVQGQEQPRLAPLSRAAAPRSKEIAGLSRQTLAPILIDGQVIGSVKYKFLDDGGLAVSQRVLFDVLSVSKAGLTPPFDAGLSGDTFISARRLREAGYALSIDPDLGAIRLSTPSGSTLQPVPDRAPTLEEPSFTSADIKPSESRPSDPDLTVAAVETPRQTLPDGVGFPPQASSRNPTELVAERPLNTTGRDISIFVPLIFSERYFSDIELFISRDNQLSVSAAQLSRALGDALTPFALAQLREGAGPNGLIDIASNDLDDITLTYNPAALTLSVSIKSDARRERSISVVDLDRSRQGRVEPIAAVSGFLNLRTALDYVHIGDETGLAAPLIDAEFAFRTNGIVFETELVADLDEASAASLQRRGTRLVYDQPKYAHRWILGDVRPTVSGLQASRNTLGLSFTRNFSRLQPQRIVRPRGRTSFSLEEASTVDVIVNNRVIRTLSLDPGQFNLSDFPFLVGENDVRIVAEDSAGRREAAAFDLYFDRTLLEPGLSEYAATIGVASLASGGGLEYAFDEPVFSGFYRRGISDGFTLGGKLQADKHVVVGGAEGSLSSPFGTIRFDGALSSHQDGETGYAVELDFERSLGQSGRSNRRFILGASATGESFALLGDEIPQNPIAYRVNAAYSQALGTKTSISASAAFSFDRTRDSNQWATGLRVSRQIGRYTAFSIDTSYEDRGTEPEFGVMVSLSRRFGRNQAGRASYDSLARRGALSYSRSSGRRVNALSVNADLDVSEQDAGFNADAYYVANRNEFGLTHIAGFASNQNEITNQRTSLRWAGAVAFADGAVALSRPISDSFAIVRGHDSLAGRRIFVDPSRRGDAESSGLFGGAVVPDIGSYNRRTIAIDVSDLPVGYNIGSGAFSVSPNYRSGYNLVVGSAWSKSIIGTAYDEFGEPISLISGTIVPQNSEFEDPIPVFTNSVGRFSATGLREGVWLMTLRTIPPTQFEFTVSDGEENYIDLGVLEAE